MKYFELLDDVTIPNRWHLGEITSKGGVEPRLRAGIRFDHKDVLRVTVSRPGRVLDFCMTSFAVPVAASGLAYAINAVAGSNLQCVPIDIAGQPEMMALNAVRVVRCLDENFSEFIKWTVQDHRADLAGQYKQVTKLRLKSELIPSDAHFFRIDGWLVALIVSNAVKEAMERAGSLGAKFKEVTQ
jgi:hypothetical protein